VQYRNLDVRKLEYLIAFADTASASDAAERCGVSLAAAGSALRAIQEIVGYPIFDEKPLRLNAAGRMLAEVARHILTTLNVAVPNAEAGELATPGMMLASDMLPTETAQRTASAFLFDGQAIGLRDPLALSEACRRLLERFGLSIERITAEDCFDIEYISVLGRRIAMYLRWGASGRPLYYRPAYHAACLPDAVGGAVGIEIGADPFAYAMLVEGDPLLARERLALTELADRTAYLMLGAESALVDGPHWDPFDSRDLLFDSAEAFATQPHQKWAWVTRSVALNPPLGFAVRPLKDFCAPATLFLMVHEGLTQQERRAAESIAEALRTELLGSQAAAA